MAGFAQHASRQILVCRLCNSSIPLETSKADEYGRAVHEECYVCTTISKFRTSSAGHFRDDWLSAISMAYD
jgi:hypothetical protein